MPYARIRKTTEKIVEDEHKKKKVEDKKEDTYSEHFGMNHAQLLIHQEITKLKTIHHIQMGKYKS